MNNFESDGRLQGTPDVQMVNCDTQASACVIKVPVPSFALVFLTNHALSAVLTETFTFPTSTMTRTRDKVFIDPSMLANSNGDYCFQNKGATSLGSLSDARPLRQALSYSIVLSCIIVVFFCITTHLPW